MMKMKLEITGHAEGTESCLNQTLNGLQPNVYIPNSGGNKKIIDLNKMVEIQMSQNECTK